MSTENNPVDPQDLMEEVYSQMTSDLSSDLCNDSMTDIEDLPDAIIVANMDASIFEENAAQITFEALFRDLDREATFIYLRNFRRARIQFSSPDFAAIARVRYDGVAVSGSSIRCYFVQKITQTTTDGSTHLQPPLPKKMFLISPPASPPVGWEPVPESEPVINYELLHAISKLKAGDSHELHPASSDGPAIVVHFCEDLPTPPIKAQIQQTARPPKPGPS